MSEDSQSTKGGFLRNASRRVKARVGVGMLAGAIAGGAVSTCSTSHEPAPTEHHTSNSSPDKDDGIPLGPAIAGGAALGGLAGLLSARRNSGRVAAHERVIRETVEEGRSVERQRDREQDIERDRHR